MNAAVLLVVALTVLTHAERGADYVEVDAARLLKMLNEPNEVHTIHSTTGFSGFITLGSDPVITPVPRPDGSWRVCVTPTALHRAIVNGTLQEPIVEEAISIRPPSDISTDEAWKRMQQIDDRERHTRDLLEQTGFVPSPNERHDDLAALRADLRKEEVLVEKPCLFVTVTDGGESRDKGRYVFCHGDAVLCSCRCPSNGAGATWMVRLTRRRPSSLGATILS
jgi:hypothetical protein